MFLSMLALLLCVCVSGGCVDRLTAASAAIAQKDSLAARFACKKAVPGTETHANCVRRFTCNVRKGENSSTINTVLKDHEKFGEMGCPASWMAHTRERECIRYCAKKSCDSGCRELCGSVDILSMFYGMYLTSALSVLRKKLTSGTNVTEEKLELLSDCLGRKRSAYARIIATLEAMKQNEKKQHKALLSAAHKLVGVLTNFYESLHTLRKGEMDFDTARQDRPQHKLDVQASAEYVFEGAVRKRWNTEDVKLSMPLAPLVKTAMRHRVSRPISIQMRK